MVIALVSILEAETDSCLEFEVSLLYIVTSRSAEGFIHVWLCYNESQRTICESQFSPQRGCQDVRLGKQLLSPTDPSRLSFKGRARRVAQW